MRIAFNTWAEAITALGKIKVEPERTLYVLYEGSVKDRPPYKNNVPTWTKGTGRTVISTCRTGEQVGLIYN